MTDYVLADLDGTLIDSQPSLERAYRWWAGQTGVDPAAAIALMPGRPSEEVVALLAPHLDAGAESARIDGRAARDDEGVIALPGAHELLDGHPADRLAIVTSAVRPLVDARMRTTGLRPPAVVITPERLERGKPHPEGYLLAARLLGAHPAECVVLEDSPAGLEAGLAAGMRVVAVTTTHAAAELPGAHAYARDVADWLARSAG